MRLSRVGYYTDFVLYPTLWTGLTTYGLVTSSGMERLGFVAAGITGLGAWTLVEYVLHRHVFHHAPLFVDMHDSHHDDPNALIGTPTWVSLPIAFALIVLLTACFGQAIGLGLTIGMMGGYLWYISVHHLVHHGPLHGSRYLYWARRRHAVHHSCEVAYFGVTTDLWDRVFRTLPSSDAATRDSDAERRSRTLSARIVQRLFAFRS